SRWKADVILANLQESYKEYKKTIEGKDSNGKKLKALGKVQQHTLRLAEFTIQHQTRRDEVLEQFVRQVKGPKLQALSLETDIVYRRAVNDLTKKDGLVFDFDFEEKNVISVLAHQCHTSKAMFNEAFQKWTED